jgi:alkylation response protein AidB-like acyl-CoA dehydrogenase
MLSLEADIGDLTAFREDVRDWLAANCPASMRSPATEADFVWGGRRPTYPSEDARLWLERMAGKGWTCPTWPRPYGGAGLSAEENKVLQQELRAINARAPFMSYGATMLGPALLEFGSEAQKLEHLPPIARGEIRWCQGYSEPGAGSDLANIQTFAERQGDHYVVQGSKIWTSYANLSDWIFCLVRTDRDGPKQQGISFLLIDLASEGVTTRPIDLISGASAFCQTFFDAVRVPVANRVGAENAGWPIAKRLLHHERNMVAGIGGASALGGRGRRLHELAKQYVGVEDGRIADPVLRDRIARHEMNDRAFQLTMARAAEEHRAGVAGADLSSMFKYYGTEQNQRKYELMLDSMGLAGLGWDGDAFDDKELRVTRQWLRSKANTIEGGTSEIQLNIIAKRVLGLPD